MMLIDARELTQYRLTLESAAEGALPEARRIVQKGSLNIKEHGRRLAPRGPHTPRYADSISYDTWTTKTAAVGEIGPRREPDSGQGDLGVIFEEGSPTSPPIPHMRPAGAAEEPRFTKAMEDLAARLLGRT